MTETEAEITAEDRREFARLRSLLVSPGSVQLLHSDHGRRVWLADPYVLVDVTGSRAVGPDLDDGPYHLFRSKGLVRKDGIPAANLPIWFGELTLCSWYPARSTRLSITDSEPKAMLCYAEIAPLEGGAPILMPFAMNEDLWNAFGRAYPGAGLWHAGFDGPFRVSFGRNEELAYIQPVRIPEDMQEIILAILEAVRRGAGRPGHSIARAAAGQ